MNNVDKFVWKILLTHGSVVDDWNVYSYAFNNDVDKKEECLDKIETIGIDWNKTEPAQDSMRSCFEDVNTPCSYAKVLVGTLILNDGSKYNWGATEVSTKDVISEILEYIPDPFE